MPDDDQFRRAVQGRVGELLSKRHNTCTFRLLVEAIVEGVRLYRDYKEQEKEEKGRKKRKSDDMRGHMRDRRGGRMDGDGKDGHRQRHDCTYHERTDGSKDGRRHQHHGRSRHRRHRNGSHSRHRSRSRYKYNDVSLRVHHDTPRSRDDHSNYHQRGETDNVHDSTTVSREENHLMSGANGYQTSKENLISDPRPHSVPDQADSSDSRSTTSTLHRSRTSAPKIQHKEQPRSLEHKNNPKLETKRVSMVHNTSQRGEQGDPLSHHQPRAHHRHSDTYAGKAVVSHSPVPRQRGPCGIPLDSLPKCEPKTGIALSFYDHFVTTYKQIKAEQDAGYRAKGYIENVLEGARHKMPERKMSKGKQGRDRKAPEQCPQEREHGDNDNEEDRLMHTQPHASGSLQGQDASTPSMEEPHSPVELKITSETSPPIIPHAPLPPPPVGRNVKNARTALFESIQSGVRLRRVASMNKKDKSAAQASQAEGKTDTGPEPNRRFREDLLNALEGRKARLGCSSDAA